MNLTEPVTKQPRRAPDARSAKELLDAFAAGGCDQATFLDAVGDLVQRSPDVGWELLALIDQYYRRGKIGAEAFAGLKAHLQNLLLGKGRDAEIRAAPAPPPEAPAYAAATAPVTGPIPMFDPGPAFDAGPVLGRRPIAPEPESKSDAPFHLERGPVDASSDAHPRGAAGPGEERPHTVRSLAVGDVLRDRYRVVAMLGQGGMGTVFEAVDEFRLERSSGEQKVALKVLHTAVIQRPQLFAELRREFQHLQLLSHPNIVRVHEFDRDGDLAFFTMEYLSGVLLTRVLATPESAPLARAHAFSIIRDVGDAVAYAHARGVVHGDLNPGNIFITDDGDLRVLDFGASHPLRRSPWISEFENSQQISVATPSYASCQLLEGETADARDDIYALACIAYVLLTGNHPFREHTALKARTQRLRPERPAGLTRRQWTALRAGLEFERDRRAPDMQAWLSQMHSTSAAAHLPPLPVLLGRSHRRVGRRPWAVAAAVAVIAAGAWWAMNHVDSLAETRTA